MRKDRVFRIPSRWRRGRENFHASFWHSKGNISLIWRAPKKVKTVSEIGRFALSNSVFSFFPGLFSEEIFASRSYRGRALITQKGASFFTVAEYFIGNTQVVSRIHLSSVSGLKRDNSHRPLSPRYTPCSRPSLKAVHSMGGCGMIMTYWQNLYCDEHIPYLLSSIFS